MDAIVLDALASYWGWPQCPDNTYAPKYKVARKIIRAPIREGGFGLTAVANVCLPAFYLAAAHSIRWISCRPSLLRLLQWDLNLPPRQFFNSFVGEFLDADEELVHAGCQRPPDPNDKPDGSVALLPTWHQLTQPDAKGQFFPLPPQRVIVRSHLSVKQCYNGDARHLDQSPAGHRHVQTIRDHTSSLLKDALGFSSAQLKTKTMVYNPMAFLMAIPVTKWQLFPKQLFQRYVRLACDLPFDDLPSICQSCGQRQDEYGHHRATCAHVAPRTWKSGHDYVVEAIASILETAGLPHTTNESQVPTHRDSNKKGDVLVQCKVGPYEDLVLDFSLTHPRTGASRQHPNGQWKAHAVATTERTKNAKHGISYAQGNHAFLSLIAETYGTISDEFVRFIWLVANYASTNSRLDRLSAPSRSQPAASSQDSPHSSLDDFAVLRGSFFSRMRVQIAAALAKAAAARFVTDGADDGLPIRLFSTRHTAKQADPLPELPLYHAPS